MYHVSCSGGTTGMFFEMRHKFLTRHTLVRTIRELFNQVASLKMYYLFFPHLESWKYYL